MANYERISWEDYPSTDTPLDSENLNKMDAAIDAINREVQQAREDIEDNTDQVELAHNRIDSLIALPDGSTTADAELVDARIGYDNTQYNSLGAAIRGQVEDLHGALDDATDELNERIDDVNSAITQNYMGKYNPSNFTSNKYVSSSNGALSTLNRLNASDYFVVYPNSSLSLIGVNKGSSGTDTRGIAFYDANKIFISGVAYDSGSLTGNKQTVTVPSTAMYCRFTVRNDCMNTYICVFDIGSTIYDNLQAVTDGIKIQITPTLESGKFVSKTGVIGNNNAFALSDYIECENVNRVYTAYSKDYTVAFYDTSKTFLSIIEVTSTSWSAGWLNIVKPTGAKYIRINDYTTVLAASEVIVEYLSSTPILYEMIGKLNNDLNNDIDTVDNKVDLNETISKSTETKKYFGKFAPNNFSDNAFVNSTTGATGTLNGLKASDYFPVYPESSLTLIGVNKGSQSVDVRGLAFYSSNKQYISGVAYNSDSLTGGTQIFTVPENAAYCRITVRGDCIDKYYAVFDAGSIIYYKLTACENTLSNLDGWYPSISMFDNIGVCGDSYTAAQFWSANGVIGDNPSISWGKILGRMCGINVSIYASSGADTETWQERSSCLPALLADTAQRLYVFALGINDYSSVTLGTISDIHEDYTNNPNTYYGNFGRIIDQVLEHAPSAKIILLKCWLTDSNYYNYSSTAIEQIASHYGIPYIDTADSAYLNSDYYKNGKIGSHPTPPQQSGMAKAIKGLIEKCIQNNPTYFNDYFPR